MAKKTQPEFKKPERFDIEKAEILIQKLIQENKEWIEEMAKK